MQALVKSIKEGQRGFTLVEIITVVAIVAILAAIGTTTLLNHLPNMRLKSATRDIYSVMMRAKTEAIRLGENVTVLFNSPGDSFIMYLDRQPAPAGATANDDNNAVDLGETILLAATQLPSRVSYDPVVVGADGLADGVRFANNSLVFSMRGVPLGLGTVGLHATDSLGNTIRQRTVDVSIAGRINIQ